MIVGSMQYESGALVIFRGFHCNPTNSEDSQDCQCGVHRLKVYSCQHEDMSLTVQYTGVNEVPVPHGLTTNTADWTYPGVSALPDVER